MWERTPPSKFGSPPTPSNPNQLLPTRGKSSNYYLYYIIMPQFTESGGLVPALVWKTPGEN